MYFNYGQNASGPNQPSLSSKKDNNSQQRSLNNSRLSVHSRADSDAQSDYRSSMKGTPGRVFNRKYSIRSDSVKSQVSQQDRAPFDSKDFKRQVSELSQSLKNSASREAKSSQN